MAPPALDVGSDWKGDLVSVVPEAHRALLAEEGRREAGKPQPVHANEAAA